MEIKTDLARLTRLGVPAPRGAAAVRWAGRVKGYVGLGPTDTEVWAVYPLDAAAWAEAKTALGSPLGATTRPVPAELQPLIGAATLQGEVYPPPPAGPGWHVAWAIWTGQALVVSAHSR